MPMRALPVALALLLAAPALAQDDGRSFIAATGPVAAEAPASAHYVVLADGERIAGEAELLPSARRPTHLLVNGTRYEMREVTAFSTEEGSYGVTSHPYTGSSMLLTRTLEGRVSLYEEQGLLSSGLEYFQKGDGDLLLVNQHNLRQELGDNPESLRHLRRHGTYQKVGTGSMVAGAALVALGAYFQFDGKPSAGTLDNPLVVAGSGVLLATGVNMVVPLLQRKANRDAIRAYNR